MKKFLLILGFLLVLSSQAVVMAQIPMPDDIGTESLEECEQIESGWDRDQCFYDYAMNTGECNVCDGVYSPDARTGCFHHCAQKVLDSSYCEEISNEDEVNLCKEGVIEAENKKGGGHYPIPDPMEITRCFDLQGTLEGDECFYGYTKIYKDDRYCHLIEDESGEQDCYSLISEKVVFLKFLDALTESFSQRYRFVLLFVLEWGLLFGVFYYLFFKKKYLARKEDGSVNNWLVGLIFAVVLSVLFYVPLVNIMPGFLGYVMMWLWKMFVLIVLGAVFGREPMSQLVFSNVSVVGFIVKFIVLTVLGGFMFGERKGLRYLGVILFTILAILGLLMMLLLPAT